jgi:ketosteroid isomerase-like protein
MFSRLIAISFLMATGLLAQDKATFENLDKAWIKAVLAKDMAGLDKILADDLIYGHASNVVDTKASYTEKIKGGKQVYKLMEQRKVTVKIFGTTGITQSWLHVTGVNPAGPFDDKVMMLHVWVKSGTGYRLAAHQTAKVDKLPD